MTTIEKTAFMPNCVFIPAEAIWKDTRGEHVDPDDAAPLMLVGDNNYGEVFSAEAWEKDGFPSFFRRFGRFVDADDNPIDPDHGRVELLPDLHVVKIEERDHWLDSVVMARTTRIFGVYVFDRRQHFHICSFSASHELHFFRIAMGTSRGAERRRTRRFMESDHGGRLPIRTDQLLGQS